MTVNKLETVKALLEEDPSVLAVYRFTQVLSGRTAYAIEHALTLGQTEQSPYVRDAVLIYSQRFGWLE